MTDLERQILDDLGRVWDKFLQLPDNHEIVKGEFCTGVHLLQNMVLARAGRRAYSGKM